MITTNIKAIFDPLGAVDLKFSCKIEPHYAREILDAVASTMKAGYTDEKLVYTEKDNISLRRKATETDLNQTELFPSSAVPSGFEVIEDAEIKQIEHDQAQIEEIPVSEEEADHE